MPVLAAKNISCSLPMCSGHENSKITEYRITQDTCLLVTEGYRYECVRLLKPTKMLKLFKRSSKLVNNHSGIDAGDRSCSIVNPVHRRELLTRYVGKGKTEEALNEIFEKSNVGKYCRITIQDKCLIVSELTDAEVVRIPGDRIVRCVQDSSNDKLCNCVAIMVGQDDRSTYLFETCSVKEVSYL